MKLSTKILAFIFVCLASTTQAKVIDIMIIGDNTFAQDNPGWEGIIWIANAINWTNQAFENSDIDLELNLVHGELYTIPGYSEVSSGLRDRVSDNSYIMGLRDTHKPDLTIYLTRSSDTSCGIAFFPDYYWARTIRTHREMAFKGVNVVGHDCAFSTFAHEIGHNLGVGHGARQGHNGKPYPESRGYGVDYVFRTIMPYASAYAGNDVELQYFSNPNVSECEGLACGTHNENAVWGMNKVYDNWVQYYSSCYPTRRAPRSSARLCGYNVCKRMSIRGCREWE